MLDSDEIDLRNTYNPNLKEISSDRVYGKANFLYRKEEIIKSSKSEFIDFLSNDTSGEIIQLFDDEGVNYLKQYNDIEGRISYILSWSKYANELFYNKNFLDLFLSTDISNYYASLSVLNNEVCDLIVNRCLFLNKDINYISTLIGYFSDEYKLMFIDKFEYPNDLIYELFKKNTLSVGKKIIEKYNIDLLSHNISIKGIIANGKELAFKDMNKRNSAYVGSDVATFYLSSDLLNKEVAKYLWNELNIYEYRFLINDIYYCGDPSILNRYIKDKEEECILSDDYIEPYKSIINMISKLYSLDYNSDEYYDTFVKLNKEMQIFGNEYFILRKYLTDRKYDVAIKLVNKLLSEKKSDYIVDYHFEENYYNIMYDLRELLDFYYAGNMNIPEDRLYLYQQLANIDNLSGQEKIDLHNMLKNYNMMEVFYDDMSFARKQVREALKSQAMVKDDLEQYKDDKLSLEYGVDVYNIEDNSFFALVKSGIRAEDRLPVGHSYSLVGNGCISVFGNLSDSNTFIYDVGDLNPEQVVHIFPTDSYTMYHPFSFSDKATSKVEQLIMPDEMLYESKFYNEILILEKGYEHSDIDKKIPKLKRIALYCVDKITDKDVMSAKMHDVGIMLIDSKKYNKGIEMPASVYRHLSRNDYIEYVYMHGGYSSEVEEHKKNR